MSVGFCFAMRAEAALRGELNLNCTLFFFLRKTVWIAGVIAPSSITVIKGRVYKEYQSFVVGDVTSQHSHRWCSDKNIADEFLNAWIMLDSVTESSTLLWFEKRRCRSSCTRVHCTKPMRLTFQNQDNNFGARKLLSTAISVRRADACVTRFTWEINTPSGRGLRVEFERLFSSDRASLCHELFLSPVRSVNCCKKSPFILLQGQSNRMFCQTEEGEYSRQ